MAKIEVKHVKKCGQQVKVIEYACPYSEYEAVCGYIKKIMDGGDFESIELEKADK